MYKCIFFQLGRIKKDPKSWKKDKHTITWTELHFVLPTAKKSHWLAFNPKLFSEVIRIWNNHFSCEVPCLLAEQMIFFFKSRQGRQRKTLDWDLRHWLGLVKHYTQAPLPYPIMELVWSQTKGSVQGTVPHYYCKDPKANFWWRHVILRGHVRAADAVAVTDSNQSKWVFKTNLSQEEGCQQSTSQDPITITITPVTSLGPLCLLSTTFFLPPLAVTSSPWGLAPRWLPWKETWFKMHKSTAHREGLRV